MINLNHCDSRPSHYVSNWPTPPTHLFADVILEWSLLVVSLFTCSSVLSVWFLMEVFFKFIWSFGFKKKLAPKKSFDPIKLNYKWKDLRNKKKTCSICYFLWWQNLVRYHLSVLPCYCRYFATKTTWNTRKDHLHAKQYFVLYYWRKSFFITPN